MIQIIVENHLGQPLQISNNDFPVTSVDGLTPAGATINTSGAGIADGTFFNSSYVNQRNIVITIIPNGDAEQARLTLYKYFKPKYNCRLYFTTNTRQVYIDGYVEKFEGSLFGNRQAFQISIICPNPFFVDVNSGALIQSFITSAFTFPVSIPEEGVTFGNVTPGTSLNVVNAGEESTGIVIDLVASGNVIGPTIYNETTRETFTLNVEMIEGDLITIDTRKGHKTITLNREGVITNILNKIEQGSTWFTLPQGDNYFTYSCAYGAVNLTIEYMLYVLYEGV